MSERGRGKAGAFVRSLVGVFAKAYKLDVAIPPVIPVDGVIALLCNTQKELIGYTIEIQFDYLDTIVQCRVHGSSTWLDSISFPVVDLGDGTFGCDQVVDIDIDASFANKVITCNAKIAAVGVKGKDTGTVADTQAPVITDQSGDLINVAGYVGKFWVTATGTPPLAYQWQQSGNGGVTWSNKAGQTSSEMSMTVQVDLTYIFRCKVSNGNGVVYSNSMHVYATPKITVQPVDRSGRLGVDSGNVSITATGNSTLTYAWYKVGYPDPISTNRTLFTGLLTLANVGQYYCIVTNPYGYVVSSTITYSVTSYAVNILAGSSQRSQTIYPWPDTVFQTYTRAGTGAGVGSIQYIGNDIKGGVNRVVSNYGFAIPNKSIISGTIYCPVVHVTDPIGNAELWLAGSSTDWEVSGDILGSLYGLVEGASATFSINTTAWNANLGTNRYLLRTSSNERYRVPTPGQWSIDTGYQVIITIYF